MKIKTCQSYGCGRPSIPGLNRGMCRYHWAKLNWGEDWAADCVPDHPEAIRHKRDSEAKAKGTP